MDCFTFMCLLCLSITLKKIIWWFERLLRVGCQSPCIVCTSVKGKEGSEKKNSQVKLTKQISNQFNKKLWAHTLYTKVERCSAKFVINVSFRISFITYIVGEKVKANLQLESFETFWIKSVMSKVKLKMHQTGHTWLVVYFEVHHAVCFDQDERSKRRPRHMWKSSVHIFEEYFRLGSLKKYKIMHCFSFKKFSLKKKEMMKK